MDYLWTPWRYTYVTAGDTKQRAGVPDELSAWPGDTGCVFCNLIAAVDYAIEHGMARHDAEQAAGIVLRAQRNYICLNRFPYTSGHIMVVPYEHQAVARRASAGDGARNHGPRAAVRTGPDRGVSTRMDSTSA